MDSTMLTEPIVARSGSSVHSREEDEFNEQNEENPLEIRSNSSAQATPNHAVVENPLEYIGSNHDDPDEPPPPYEERVYQEPVQTGPQTSPVEFTQENSPQLHISPQSEFPEVVRRPVSSSRSPSDGTLYPDPLQLRPSSSNGSLSPRSPREEYAQRARTFSSAKAREAGFEIQRKPVASRSNSTSSIPSITVLSPTEPLKHIREPGKLMAYLIPFPKPRLQGVRAEEIPDRFLVYTPSPPPLSKPAPGEKETQWHKNRRQWQDDIRKVMMSNATKGAFKGLKAKTVILIGKGVDATKSTQLELLDRAMEEAEPDTTIDSPTPQTTEQSPVEAPGVEAGLASPHRTDSSTSIEKPKKPKSVEELTLIYPPTLPLTPDQIRIEFVELLLRTREKSRRDAIISSSLFPVAAALDATLLFTFGGLMEVSGVWAYTSIRGTMASKKMAKELNRTDSHSHDQTVEIATSDQESQPHIQGCTCGLHEDSFGPQHEAPQPKNKGKSKAQKPGINLRMQQSPNIEILRRYLELACLKKDFSMFPQVDQVAGDVNEAAVLDAIGWRPTRRSGRDLDMEVGDKKVESLTQEEDELWQTRAEREDVKRFMKKGAKEWVEFCKTFQKEKTAACKK